MNVNSIDNEVDEESPFTYKESTPKGPESWGNLNPKWRVCKNGKFQSPIDLLNEKVKAVHNLGHLKRKYKPAPATIINRGHDIMVAWKGDTGAIEINGTEYKLKQCHWHSPSEHSINIRNYDLELHMVHNTSSGLIAVIGVLYKYGQPDPFISKGFEENARPKQKWNGRSASMYNPNNL